MIQKTMKTPRKLLILVSLLIVVMAAAWLLRRRSQQPPDSVRMLPEGEVILYANLRPVRLWESGTRKAETSEAGKSGSANQNAGPAPSIQIEGDYQNFISQTGIQFERDLDEIAMSRRDTPDHRDTESAEVITGRFDEPKLTDYLGKISSLRETYRDHTIFVIPHDGHNVRVCLLGNGRVAITNMPSGDPIRGMVDSLAKLPAGPTLAQLYYDHVPLASLGWMITRVEANSSGPQLPNGWSFDFLQNTTTVLSVRFAGDVLVRADVITAGEKEAKHVMDGATSFLALYQTVATSVSPKGTDQDVKAALSSIEVHQEKSAAVFNATLSQRFLKKLVSEAQTEATSSAPSPTPSPAKMKPKKP